METAEQPLDLDEPHEMATDSNAAAGTSAAGQMSAVDAPAASAQPDQDVAHETTNQQNSNAAEVEESKPRPSADDNVAEPPTTTTEPGETRVAEPAVMMDASSQLDAASVDLGPPAVPSSLPPAPASSPINTAGETTTSATHASGGGVPIPAPAPAPLGTAPIEENAPPISANDRGHFNISTNHEEEESFGDDNDDDDEDNIRYTDEDIQRDASSIAVMAMVNVALIFFAGLFVCAIAGSILFMGQFGFVTLCIVICLVGIVVGTVAWIAKIITGDKKLRPVQRKMRRWRAIAKAVVVNEIINFRLDMQEHLLLTNGGECGDPEDDGYYEEMNASDNNDGTSSGQQASTATNSSARNAYNGKSRSVIFGLMVKPFVKGRKKMKRKLGRKKKDKAHDMVATNEAEGGAYVPPAVGTEMV